MSSLKLTITHLYPQEMNLYGDLGNVICLVKRCQWRGIEVEIINKGLGEDLETTASDLYFFGGGQDQDQLRVFTDLLATKQAKLKADLESGVAMLAICGGYQLLGEYFLDGQGQKIVGLGFLPLETVAPGPEVAQRAIGNLITRLEPVSAIANHPSQLKTLVGFENHSGRTRLVPGSAAQILGRVLVGEGDNEDGLSDGIIYKNTIGSYMHGSLLPKNPHLADYLIQVALARKYQEQHQLTPLDDSLEVAAHKAMLTRYNLSNEAT